MSTPYAIDGVTQSVVETLVLHRARLADGDGLGDPSCVTIALDRGEKLVRPSLARSPCHPRRPDPLEELGQVEWLVVLAGLDRSLNDQHVDGALISVVTACS